MTDALVDGYRAQRDALRAEKEKHLILTSKQVLHRIYAIWPEGRECKATFKDGCVRLHNYKFWSEESYEHGQKLLVTWVCRFCGDTGYERGEYRHIEASLTLGAIGYFYEQHRRNCRPDARRKR